MIQLSLEKGFTVRTIALSLNKSAISVSRELASNPVVSSSRKHTLRRRLLGLTGPLWSVVTEPFLPNSGLAWLGKLTQWSQTLRCRRLTVSCGLKSRSCSNRGSAAAQIVGTLPRMYPDDLSMRVSHETAYTALYAMPCGEDRRGEMPDRISIHQRPPEVDDRVIPGQSGRR